MHEETRNSEHKDQEALQSEIFKCFILKRTFSVNNLFKEANVTLNVSEMSAPL